MNDDLISRAEAIDEIRKCRFVVDAIEKIIGLPSAQPDVPDTNVGKMDGDELDEAIRHCDEIVQDITWFCNSPSKYIEQRRHESAVKLRQLASWLRELKRLRTEVYFLKAEKENEPVDLLGDVPCKTCKWRITTTEKCEECIDGVSDNYEVQEPCDDAVSREAAIDVAENAFVRGLLASPDIRRLPSVQPESYEDAVSRDSVKFLLCEETCHPGAFCPDGFCKEICEKVDALPSATPKQRMGEWFPVSERLPESKHEDLEYPTVIVCCGDGAVTLACYYESTKEWGTGEYYDRIINPVAWMPLPEPYAERRTDVKADKGASR